MCIEYSATSPSESPLMSLVLVFAPASVIFPQGTLLVLLAFRNNSIYADSSSLSSAGNTCMLLNC